MTEGEDDGYVIPMHEMPTGGDEDTARMAAQLILKHGAIHPASASHLLMGCLDPDWVLDRIDELVAEGRGERS